MRDLMRRSRTAVRQLVDDLVSCSYSLWNSESRWYRVSQKDGAHSRFRRMQETCLRRGSATLQESLASIGSAKANDERGHEDERSTKVAVYMRCNKQLDFGSDWERRAKFPTIVIFTQVSTDYPIMYSWLPLLLTLSSRIWAYPHDPNGQLSINDDFELSSTIRDTLLANEIIGDVLDDFEPSYYIDLVYPKYHETVSLGNDIPVSAVQNRPVFTFHALNPTAVDTAKNSTFTLILTDPDAKSRDNPKWSEMCHWILTNLTSPTPEPPPPSPKITKKDGELKGYKPPGPPPKTGAHRYVFVLLQGDSSNIKAPKKRKHWGYGKVRHGVRDWAAENDLVVVGANFFFAENEKQ